MGTVPTGTGLASMMARRMRGRSPPVERSITVSEPYSTENWSFFSSSSMLELTAELPMLALILQVKFVPITIGSRAGGGGVGGGGGGGRGGRGAGETPA